MTTTTKYTEITRHTADDIRVVVEDGIVYKGFYAVHRKPLDPCQVALFVGVVSLCDSSEVKAAVDLCRKLSAPGEVWKALETKRTK